MKHTVPFASFFIACCALSTGAQSQNVYRCGDTYSQKPCADAVVVDVSDPRSPAQKAKADAETRRELAAAKAMEKARLNEEAQVRSDSARLTATQNAASATATEHAGTAPHQAKKGHARKKKEPEYFTARGAASKPAAAASSTR